MSTLTNLERVAGAISLSDEEVEQNYAYRERYEAADGLESTGANLEANLPPDIANISAADLAKLISQEAHDLVLYYEVAGKSGYERKYKFPVWPGIGSGITIGCGYDIGYNTTPDFERSWKALLPDTDFGALSRTVGRKGETAHGLLSAVKHIVVPWECADAVYRATTVPTFARLVLATFPNAKELHPHSFGALFSLVYNRGAKLTGPKRQHMLAIHNHMRDRRFAQVPREIRDMKVLWGANMSGLHKRRDSEAALFEQGLIEAERATVVPVLFASAGPASLSGARPGAAGTQSGVAASPSASHTESLSLESLESVEGDWAGMPEDITDDMPQPPPADAALESLEAAPGWTAISWVQNEDHSTEYGHIIADDRTLKDCEFELSARDLDLLIRANAFEPDFSAGKIIFGLRGATLLGSTSSPDDRLFQIERASLRLKEARPDHSEFRCVIGVYDLATQRLSGFIASTVPKRDVVHGFAKNASPACNLLPCGCYTYVVGPHRGKAGCLRETEDYAVLRNRNNMTYDTGDIWESGFPADNIHPSFADPSGSAKFSSLGCQVIQGNINKSTGAHIGVWAKFRTTLGLLKPGTGDHNKKFSYVLLTGLEAATAARLRSQGKDTDFAAVLASLGRLRQGSRGDHVRRLQAALKLKETGILDAATKVALAKLQADKLKWADGVYAPAMDQALSLNIYGTAPEPPLVIASLPGSPRYIEGVKDPLEGLYYEIGRRSVIARTNPALAGLPQLPHLESTTQESLADILGVGQRVFVRIERAAHDLICGDQVSDAGDRTSIQQSLVDAARLGPDQVIEKLTDILVASLGILNPIAAIAAKIIVRKVLEPALKDVHGAMSPMIQGACTAWARELNQRVVLAGLASDSTTAVASASPAAAGTTRTA
jgi:hypothetical protein